MIGRETQAEFDPHNVPVISVAETRRPFAFKDALRMQESFTARAERKALAWLAVRLPARVNSDHLTLLGFVAMILAGASYALARSNRAGLVLATIFLALNWFGDSLDGTLARLRKQLRPRYGFYVDHMVDTFGGFFLMGGLAHFWDRRLAHRARNVYRVPDAFRASLLAAYTLGTFRLSFAKFGPTEIRILLALGNVTLWFRSDTPVFGSVLSGL